MVNSTRKSLICGRADKVLGATAAALAAATGAGMVGTTSQADADVVTYLNVNIDVPLNIDGVYVNLLTGATGTAGGSVAGWDINPYGSGGLNFFSAFAGGNFVAAVAAGNPASLIAGTTVDAASIFSASQTAVANGVNGWFLPGTNYVGMRFLNEATAATNYGWMLMSNTATNRTIVSYAYDNTGVGIGVAAVPEPTTLGLLAAGAIGLVTFRRRSVA